MHFDVTATDGAARAGVLRTAHGDVPTPAFMPVGTKATVKSLHPDEVREAGAHILLGNTYHLHFRPGEELVAELGGLHAFMGWNGPILTDSGGFQVFSLRDTIAAVDDEGVTFRSVYDGTASRFTPESVARDPGAARLRHRDVPRRLPACRRLPGRGRGAVRLTTSWATRQREAPRAPGQLVFGIAQGGSDRELRTRSIAELTELDFDGYALGGLSVGEPRPEMLDTVGWAAPLLPAEKPRYFMGIGDPEGILEVIARGIDMFDCVLPTRLGRTGTRPDLARPPQPPERAVHARPATARRALRLPGVHALLARVHPPPRQPAGAPRAPAPQPAQFGSLLDLTAGARAAIQAGRLADFIANALADVAREPL